MPDILDEPKPELGMGAVLDELSKDDDGKSEDKLEDGGELDLQVSDEPEEKEEDEEKEEQQEESEEEPELSLEDKDPDGYLEVPARKTILKKYPEFFKDFPDVEKAIYREQAYTETFGTVKEAKEAKEIVDNYRNIEVDLYNGRIDNIFAALKQNSPDAFKKATGTYLHQLANVDKDAYFGTVNSVLKQAIITSYSAGKQAGGEDGEQLMLAAQLLHRYIYGTANITPPQQEQFDAKPNPREEELNKRETQFKQQQLGIAVNDVTARIESSIRTGVEKAIDPKGIMPEYVKSKAIEDVMSQCDRLIQSDRRFTKFRDDLWKEAIENNYSESNKAKIRSAVIRKAQSILPDIIRKVRAEAMNGLSRGKRVIKNNRSEESDNSQRESRRQTPPQNRNQNGNNRPQRLGGVKDVMKLLGD